MFGLFQLSFYERTPASANAGPLVWPGLGLPRGAGHTLVVSIHPQCPCTRATVEELAVINTHCPSLHMDLLFIKPQGMRDSWLKSDTWSKAQKFPRCSVIADEDGHLSAAMHALSSGQANLYDPRGHLIYSGGITAGRGHVGDNAGVESILALANGNRAEQNRRPVFGCPLFAPSSCKGR